jgi:uncharacterized SAM-binding protein YcdF (DUF218 family)
VQTSAPANKPSDHEADYQGAPRPAAGYQYWATSQEEEEAGDVLDRITATDEVAAVVKERRRVLPRGAFRRTTIRLVSLVLILILVGVAYVIFNYFQVTGAAGDDTTRPVDAIIVLGAAQYNGSPSYVLGERLDHAFNLYSEGIAPIIMTTGAGAEGDITTEGLVGLEHLRAKDVPESDIVLIPEGTNSWEQLSASAFQIERLQLDSVLLVSDGYHNYRLLDIADELGIEAYVSPSIVEARFSDNLREAVAVSIGRITGYRRLSAFTENSG